MATFADDDGAGVVGEQGTWVVGDRIDPSVGKPPQTPLPRVLRHSTDHYQKLPRWWDLRDNLVALTSPTIFKDTGPHDCRVPDFMGPHWADYPPARTNCSWGVKY